jgi:hypothetical protein
MIVDIIDEFDPWALFIKVARVKQNHGPRRARKISLDRRERIYELGSIFQPDEI